MRRRILIILAVILAVAVAGWFFDAPTRLGWVKPAVTRLSLYGNVDIREVRLGFRVSGRLAEMNVEEGDAVEAGAILARLDTRPLWDQIRAADAKLAAQAANLARLEAGPRPAEIAKARAQHVERLAELQNASMSFGRTNQLQSSGASSKASLDQARANRDMAAARADAAAEDLRLIEQGTRVEEIAAAKANYQEAEANLATAQTSLADAELKAPAGGVILSRVREPGAIVSMGETVLVLSLVKPVWVRAYISEPDLGRVHPGMAVEVVSDTRPDQPYRGTVGFISSVAEFTPKTVETADLRTDLVYRLRVVVNDDGSGLRQGMPVTVRIPDAKIAADDGPS